VGFAPSPSYFRCSEVSRSAIVLASARSAAKTVAIGKLARETERRRRCRLTPAVTSVSCRSASGIAKPRTITELRWRLKQSEEKFGSIPLAELEGMSDEIAGWAVTLSERLRYPLMAAFRQALEAGIRYGYLMRNPAKLAGPNPMPSPRGIRVYTPDELTAIVGRARRTRGSRRAVRCDHGLRPTVWASVERRDVDKARRVVLVRGTNTARSRREVPLTTAALGALDDVPPRIDTFRCRPRRSCTVASQSTRPSAWQCERRSHPSRPVRSIRRFAEVSTSE
jgi:integrase